jgi:hypothetical protein
MSRPCTRAYGATPGLTHALAGLAAHTRAHGWWRPYGATILDDFGIYTVLEDAASDLAGYASCQVRACCVPLPWMRSRR